MLSNPIRFLELVLFRAWTWGRVRQAYESLYRMVTRQEYT